MNIRQRRNIEEPGFTKLVRPHRLRQSKELNGATETPPLGPTTGPYA